MRQPVFLKKNKPMNQKTLSFRAAMLAVAAASLFAFVSLFSSVATAQIRQTTLYVDNGAGLFSKLVDATGSSGGTLLLPSGDGTLMTSSDAVVYGLTGASPQNSATTGYLFNVAYAASPGTTVDGAVINATSSGTNVSATGLTVAAASTTAGGTVTGLTSSAQGGGTTGSDATLGVVGLANTSTFTLPIPGQSSYQDASTEIDGGGAAVVGYNMTDADNQFAGYFYGNKTNKNAGNGDATGVLTAINDIQSPIDGSLNGQPAAGLFRSYDNSPTSGTGGEAVPTAVYADSYTGADLSAAVGVMAHAVTTAAGVSTVGTQAGGCLRACRWR